MLNYTRPGCRRCRYF